MTISLVIPAYNEEKYLGKTLDSIFQSKPENLLEVIVVNNACTDNTAMVASSHAGVTVVNQPEKGLTKARQKGLEAARGNLIAYIDADTLVSKKWFEIVNREFGNSPDLVCLSGPYYYYDLPLFHNLFIKWFWNNGTIAANRVVGYAVFGGNFVAKRSALLKIGGFDQTVAFYGEDTEIGRRLAEVGRVTFDRELSVNTSGRRLIKEGPIRTAFRYGLNYWSMALFHKAFTAKYKDIR